MKILIEIIQWIISAIIVLGFIYLMAFKPLILAIIAFSGGIIALIYGFKQALFYKGH